MAKRILIGCFGVPGWESASTSAYQLFRRMRKDDFEVGLVNIIAEDDAAFFRYTFGEFLGNPLELSGVENCFLEGPSRDSHPELAPIVEAFAPDVFLAVGWFAALLLKAASKSLVESTAENTDEKTPVAYLATGCEQLTSLLEARKFKDFVGFESYSRGSDTRLGFPVKQEHEAFLAANLVLPDSECCLFLHDQFFRAFRGKISRDVIWSAEWIAEEAEEHSALAKPFGEREIEVVAVSHTWDVPEKNYELLKRLSRRCRGREFHIVGDTGKEIRGAKHHGSLRSRTELFEILGNAKTLVCPSKFDTGPDVLFEASVLGCNVVSSRNCGHWKLCHPELLVDPYTVEEFERCVELALTAKFEDNMAYFKGAGSYENLREIVAVL